MDLPQEFVLRMKQMLGSEFPEFMDSYGQPRKRGLRVNTLKMLPEQLEKAAGFHLQPVPWLQGGYTYEEEDAASRHPFYYAGLYYLQEPSAMTPASVLDVRPGMKVLDLCAAPGGKATALGANLQGEGLLVANDASASRCRALLRNIEMAGITNAFVTNAPGQTLGAFFPEYFDRVLVDAPCSGEGMFRKDESVMRAWEPDKPARCAVVQRELILQAADMLRPGGRMAYSTCTFAAEENEEVIAYLLEQRPEMQLLPIPWQSGFAEGWNGLRRCVRLFPHRIAGEGHFLALLEKGGSSKDAQTERKQNRRKKNAEKKNAEKKNAEKKRNSLPDREQAALVEAFLQEHGYPWGGSPRTSAGELQRGLEIRGGQAYQSAIDPAKVQGIPFLRNGIYLGECKKDRFEPSQALALSSSWFRGDGESPALLSLAADDPRLSAFLRGETLELDETEARKKGWRLVAAEGYPLGWGKCTGTILKNKIPAPWRMM